MKQRVGDKKRREVEAKVGRPIRSMWARGGRNPRYWDVFFGTEDDTEGETGAWYPQTEVMKISDIPWKARS